MLTKLGKIYKVFKPIILENMGAERDKVYCIRGNTNYKEINATSGKAIVGTVFGGSTDTKVASVPAGKTFTDYQQLYNGIAKKLKKDDHVDQGSGRYGLLTRLAWHASGTYDEKTNTGGSYAGTMIYAPEASDFENSGLEVGRDFLVEFKYEYPWVSRGDLWTLGGVVAVQESGGPRINWRPGRVDLSDKNQVPKNGLLPDPSKGASHVRNVFDRMGFNDQETVALIGAHCLGRCHTWRSGYDGPWSDMFNKFTNDFYVQLMEDWHLREWIGPKQWQDDESNEFMMLPTDMALKKDCDFVKYVKQYATDQDLFFADFSRAFTKLLEKGIIFPTDSVYYKFETLNEQSQN